MPSPTVTVNGVSVPRLGFGTWQVTGVAAREGVRDALQLGYRHIDTAKMYANEVEVGEGLRESGVPREDVWLTSKVWIDAARESDLRRSAEQQLTDLGVDRLDLLLLHWPAPEVPLEETLRALTALRDEGLIGELGVSNFTSALLREAAALAPVFTNQVEYHAYLAQDAVLAACHESSVMLTAYSPFAHGRLLDDPVLADVAAAHHATPGQVALAWLLEQELVAAIPKASSNERRAENLGALDLELSSEEHDRIGALRSRHMRTANPGGLAPAWD
ncbi:MAG: aldo/keto reductase [Actinomycetota bacterium]|nr:aldo/keto reductase [Actinomycetota bacterium]